ncbi:MAG: DUF4342 domain-containing protein [Tissierellales bacterium]|nr:DUF4342 domain-containing protein [Tissierellales bacterium]
MFNIKHESKGLVSHGVSACAGCGLEIIMRKVMDVLGEDTIIIIPPGCSALFSGFGDESGLKIPGFQGNLENTAACASGVRAALKVKGNNHTNVLAFAGDGATVDIGLQSLSGVLERREKIMYICYDNEAYMNTGIQGSSSTPLSASDDDVLEELKKLVKEVTASKIIVKKDEETIINLPITAGAIGLVLAPLLSIGGLTVAMLSKYEVIIIAKDGTKYNLNKKFEDSIKKYSDS